MKPRQLVCSRFNSTIPRHWVIKKGKGPIPTKPILGVQFPLILVALMYLGQEVYSIFFIRDNVANLIHIVGGICGIGMGLQLRGKA